MTLRDHSDAGTQNHSTGMESNGTYERRMKEIYFRFSLFLFFFCSASYSSSCFSSSIFTTSSQLSAYPHYFAPHHCETENCVDRGLNDVIYLQYVL